MTERSAFLQMGKRGKQVKTEGIRIQPAYDRPEDVRALFSEYTEMLAKGDPAIREYLAIQNYEKELEHLEEKYGPPEGRLYLAYVGDRKSTRLNSSHL